jgi:hypothetical protein
MAPADGSPPHQGGGPWRKMPAVLAVVGALLLVVAFIAVMQGRSRTPAALRAAGQAAPPVVFSQVEGWRGGQVRPAAIYIGQGGAPYLTALRWLSWTAAGAVGDGYLHRQRPGCAGPAYRCRYQRFEVQVRLGDVRTHGTVRFYARMWWTYRSDQHRSVIGWRNYRGYWRGTGRSESRSALI